MGIGVAAAIAQAIQVYLQHIFEKLPLDLTQAGVVGLVGAACGAVIGFIVPYTYRSNVIAPVEADMARDLESLVEQAKAVFRSNWEAARQWAFSPHSDLHGISPAEAIQYDTQVHAVWGLLGCEPPRPAAERCTAT